MFRLRTALLLAMLVSVCASAQRDLRVERIVPRKQVALVIGNSAYVSVNALKNPVNDADAMAQQLRELSYDVLLVKEASRRQMGEKIDEFIGRLGTGDVGLFYYAGHGVQLDGENYLIPVDFQGNSESDVRYDALAVGKIQDRMERSGAQLNILVLDACRTNPFRFRSRAGTTGWAEMSAGRGTYIAFATAPNSVASDNSDTPNGLFTQYLLQALSVPGLGLDEVFNFVRARVDGASASKQLPWTHSSVVGQYFFRPPGDTTISANPVPRPPASAAAQPSDPISVGPPKTQPTELAPTASGGRTDQEANVIAMKDIGPLRVVLKSVLPIRLSSPYGHSNRGIRCSFDFVNRETGRPVVVAMNAMPGNPFSGGYYSRGALPVEGTSLGNILRTTLLDERATLWNLSASGMTGMSLVSVGKRTPLEVFSPTEIVSVLQRQDETGTNMTKGNANYPDPFAFVFGSTTTIPPGESVSITMSFLEEAPASTTSGQPPRSFQFNSEIVVGVTTGGKKSYALYNLTFDRVSMPGF